MKKITITLITIIFTIQIFAQNITADTVKAKKYTEIGKAYFAKLQYDSASIYYQKSSTIFLNYKQWNKFLESETNKANCSRKTNKFKKALEIYNNALNTIPKNKKRENIYTAKAYFFKAIAFWRLSKIDSTAYFFKKALKIQENIIKPPYPDLIDSYNHLGMLNDEIGNLKKAKIFYYKALELAKKIYGEKHSETINIMTNIGVNLLYSSDFQVAEKMLNRTLKINIELVGKDDFSNFYIYNPLSVVYKQKDDLDKTLLYSHKGLELVLKYLKNNKFFIASMYTNIAVVYKKKSELFLALDYTNKALLNLNEVFEGKDNIQIANNYNNLGTIYSDMNNYDKALLYFKKAKAMYSRLLGNECKEIAMADLNIGAIYIKINDNKKANNYLKKSLKIRIKLFTENSYEVARTYFQLGITNFQQKNFDQSIKYFEKTITIINTILKNKHSILSGAYNNISDVYYEQKFYDKYINALQKSLISNMQNYNDTDVCIVPTIKNYISWSDLLISLQRKAKIFADTSKNLTCIKNIPLSRFMLSLVHYHACDNLINTVRKEIKTKSDKIALGEKASEVYMGGINVCLQLYKLTNEQKYIQQAFYFSEKNKSSVLLEALAGAEALNFTGIPDTLLELEHKLSINNTNYINLKNNAQNDSLANIWSDRLFNSQRSYDSLITVFETKYPEYYNLKYNNSPATIKQVLKLLNKKTAMLSYFIGDSTITVFALTKKKYIVKQITTPDSLTEKIENYRNYISNTELLQQEVQNNTHNSIIEYNKLAYKFYNLLFPKEIQELLSKRIENLIIIPDGQLATIPFETLHTKKYTTTWTNWKNTNYFSKMPYLITNYNISYGYSATLHQQTSPKQKADKVEITPLNDWIAFAPVFDDENTGGTTTRTRNLLTSGSDSIKTRRFLSDGTYITPLPGTEKEVKTIYNLYNNQNKKALIKTHLQANENSVKTNELQNYKIIHFATHGFVNEQNPKFSGILFAQDTTVTIDSLTHLPHLITQQNEGILYQSEIYNLKFNADLIVLSACETGLGKITKGEGVIGLTRALLYAGTKNIIVSLWQVSDASTKELMINFYKNLLNNKKQDKFAKPLSKAKRQMIKNGKYAHPYFWSPFILIGE